MRVLPCVVFLSVCGGEAVRAAEAPARPAVPAQTPAIFVPKSAPTKKAPARATAPRVGAPTRRAISPEMSAKISAIATQAAPPPRAATAEKGSTGESASSDAVQLDPFYVEEEKFPEFKQRDMLTPQGKLDLAYKRHPGLKLGKIPLFNDGVARELIEDEFARERKKEMQELGGLMAIGREGVPAEQKKQLQETRARTDDAWHQSGGPFRERK